MQRLFQAVGGWIVRLSCAVASGLATIASAGLVSAAPAATLSGPTLPQLKDQRLTTPDLPPQDEDALPDVFETSVLLDDHLVTIHLQRRSLRSPDAVAIVDHGGGKFDVETLPPARTYRGTIVGEEGSGVAASLLPGGLVALLERGDGTRWHVEPIENLLPQVPVLGLARPIAPSGIHVSYRAEDVIRSGFRCGNDLTELGHPDHRHDTSSNEDAGGDGGVAGTTKYLAEIAFDADYEFFQKNSSSVTATVDDMESVMNQVEFIYDRDVDIDYEFTTFVVRDTPSDPYTSTDAVTLLCEFRAKWNSSPEVMIQREVAHLFTGKTINGSTIGIGWVGVVCNQSGTDCGANGNLAYSLVESKYSGGTFNDRIALSAHELGHNWGASHCDGTGDCHIMCSVIEGCNGIAGANLKFGAVEQSQIVSYRNSVSCDMALTAPLTLPFTEQWPTTTISTSKWVYNKGTSVSTSATNEPSAANSLNLDALGSNLYDDDEIRSHFILLGGVTQQVNFTYWTEHKGVESGEKLFVDYLNNAGDWITINTITSNGVDETNFTQWTHVLPADAKHDLFRIRFRADVNEVNDEWYLDDISVALAAGPANDECTGAIAITQATTAFDNTNATTSALAAPTSCNDGHGTTLIDDLWYSYTSSCTGVLTVTTCNLTTLDTRLILYPGPTCPTAATVPLGCDDDTAGCFSGTSAVQIPVTNGQQILIRVGVIATPGTGSLLVSCTPACPDADNDGVCDANDGCPNDPNKIAPGACGCGVPDTDSDGDGVANCVDGCPNDPNKTSPGTCGCGVPDTDSDGDGTPNCVDGCPSDPNKTAPGTCGCGVPDTDSDGDGVANCNDGCPNDPNKIAPGTCGCGVPDTDSDGDGVPNCNDGCPNDPNKIAPGTCGCGVPDTDSDGDGVPNCNDGCPNDPLKLAPGTCGCGVPDTDSDSDGTPDCNDLCPSDPLKVAPGTCGCGVPDTDSDGDGVPNCNDGCPNDPNKIAPGTCGCGVPDTDSDSDGTPDCVDGCPSDPLKVAPGTCGCGVPDTDSDADGTPDCNDGCPSDPLKTAAGTCGCGVPDTDSDGDGTPDCNDLCPSDPLKIAPGACGCGVPDSDSDGDGTADCDDGCPNDPNKVVPGSCGCGVPDTDSDGDGVANCNDGCPNDPNKTAPGTCGCGTPDTDSDGDGVADCNDLCPNDPLKVAPGTCGCGVPDTDSDGDGVPNCNDGCPDDPNKIAAGACGCGVPDVDSDSDGVPDCNDGCPSDPAKIAPGACGCGVPDVDSDSDGTPDCLDGCPSDPLKIAPGTCGCGVPDTDLDGDGVLDCNDLCPSDPLKSAPGVCGCGVPDTDSDLDGVPDCFDLCPGYDDTLDCNENGVPDGCDIHVDGTSADLNANEVPDECECIPDLDHDGVVSGSDLAILLGGWGTNGVADLDASGTIDGADLAILLGGWGPCLN